MSKYLKSFIYISVFISCSSCTSQVNKAPIEDLFNAIGNKASVGIQIIDLNKVEVNFSYQPDIRLTPASLLKIVTTSAALSQLGKDYRFKTTIGTNGNFDKKSLDGDLIIRGGGDPTIGSSHFKFDDNNSFFQKILSILEEKNTKLIKGDLILVDDFYGELDIPGKRLWEDIGNYYSAIPHGLSYNDNTFYLSLKSPSQVGGVCSITKVNPLLKDVTFKCDVKSANNNKDNAYIYGVPGLNKWMVRGTIPKGRDRFVIKGALPNPAMALGQELKHFLITKGILITGTVRVVSSSQIPEGELTILNYESPALNDIIQVVNQKSNNLYADHIFLQMDKENGGDGSWSSAAGNLKSFWSDQLKFDLDIQDGSGLSPMNCLSANELTRILQYDHSNYYDDFKSTLSVGGKSGTLKGLWKNYPDKVFGKSGSMKGVIGYAGYFKSIKENDFAFAIIINHSDKSNTQQRKAIEDFISYLIENN